MLKLNKILNMNSYNPHLVTVDTRYLNIGYLDTPDISTYLYVPNSVPIHSIYIYSV